MRLLLALLTCAFALSLATCGGHPAGVLAPDRARDLAFAEAPPRDLGSVERVLVGARGLYVLAHGGAFRAADGAQSGELGDIGIVPASAGNTWVDATEIDALEGSGRWTLGLEKGGAIVRLRGGGGLEPMNARLGVRVPVKRMSAFGRGLALLTADAVLLAEATQITRVPLERAHDPVTPYDLAATRSMVAVVGDDRVVVVELQSKRTRTFRLEGARAVAIGEHGELVVATEAAIYGENGSGELRLRYTADDDIGGLSIEGARTWFTEGSRVGFLEDDGAKLSVDLGLGALAQVAPAASRVWIVGVKGARGLSRAEAWPVEIERIAVSACTSCHRTGGEGPFDLATPEAFRAHRGDVERVLRAGTMPPNGRGLSSEDRVRLLNWIGG
jgi:hypothetical protein